MGVLLYIEKGRKRDSCKGVQTLCETILFSRIQELVTILMGNSTTRFFDMWAKME